ncbi:MAG: CPBP family intramembrane metalloprotease [Pyrinomonadaceae bacterium]|nr:CPBP family intramembrane metalloprotease [Pyrinomonadaceae bacterium]
MNLKQVFINPVGRLRSGWRLLIFALLFLVLLFMVETVIRLGYAVAVQIAPNRSLGKYALNIVFRTAFLLAALLAAFICARWLEGLPTRALGLSFNVPWLREFLVGSVLGVLSLALAAGIATAGGGLAFTISGSAGLLQVGQTLVLSGLLFIIAALAEEVLFRGYPLQTLTRARLVTLGVLLTSVPFAAVHLDNPNSTGVFPFINTALAGVWLAVAYLRTRTLWFPLGVHWAWNWALGSLFGLPVSGLTDLAPHPLLRGIDSGPAWLTGGSYGIEGGLACTIALIISTLFIWRTGLVAPTDEMKRLTSQENPSVAALVSRGSGPTVREGVNVPGT